MTICVLVGPMGAGKSTVAGLLAESYGVTARGRATASPLTSS